MNLYAVSFYGNKLSSVAVVASENENNIKGIIQNEIIDAFVFGDIESITLIQDNVPREKEELVWIWQQLDD